MFTYYKCYCVDFFFLVSNLNLSFLIYGSIGTADILDEGRYGLLLLFFFLKKNSLFSLHYLDPNEPYDVYIEMYSV